MPSSEWCGEGEGREGEGGGCKFEWKGFTLSFAISKRAQVGGSCL